MHLFPSSNALVAVSKGMQAVKLCTNKILQVDLYDGRKTVVVLLLLILCRFWVTRRA